MVIMLNFSYFLWVYHGHRLVFLALFSSTSEETKMTAVNARFEPLLHNKAIEGGRQRMESNFMRRLLMFSSDTTFPLRCFMTTTVSKD